MSKLQSQYTLEDLHNKCIHFIGIGGIGMSSIANILHEQGFKIQGSDIADNTNTNKLKKLGAKIFVGHNAKNIIGADILVKSSIITDQNAEIIEAKKHNLIIMSRADILAAIISTKDSIVVSGSHGKSTTTAMIGHMMAQNNYNPTIVNGAIMHSFASNSVLGGEQYAVVEADESDASFLKLFGKIAIVTNIDREHLDYYGNFEQMHNAFVQFMQCNASQFLVACKDNDYIQQILSNTPIDNAITYSIEDKTADIYAYNIKHSYNGSSFDIRVNNPLCGEVGDVLGAHLSLPGNQYIYNALAAITTLSLLKCPFSDIIDSLKKFSGIKRRFEFIGTFRGATVIDDYAHHPKEIEETLKSVAQLPHAKIIVIMEPHKHARLQDLFQDFVTAMKDIENLIVIDVHSVGEEYDMKNVNSKSLVQAINNTNHNTAIYLSNIADLPATLLAKGVGKEDVILFMGAGKITQYAHDLIKQVELDEKVC